MRWDHFLSAHNDVNHRLFSEALANAEHILDIAEESGVQLGEGSIGNYIRTKQEINEYNKLYDNTAEPEPIVPTVTTPSVRYEKPWA